MNYTIEERETATPKLGDYFITDLGKFRMIILVKGHYCALSVDSGTTYQFDEKCRTVNELMDFYDDYKPVKQVGNALFTFE